MQLMTDACSVYVNFSAPSLRTVDIYLPFAASVRLSSVITSRGGLTCVRKGLEGKRIGNSSRLGARSCYRNDALRRSTAPDKDAGRRDEKLKASETLTPFFVSLRYLTFQFSNYRVAEVK